MNRQFTVFLFILFPLIIFGQYQFKGELENHDADKTVYLSIIEDYRKISRISNDQFIAVTKTDSLGYFSFSGDNLDVQNRIYRIHIDDCQQTSNASHIFGDCTYDKSILFIANVKDTINFPLSFIDEALCAVSSTNISATLLLDIDALKEEMAFELQQVNSVASRKLNFKNWFKKFQKFGEDTNEPLAELYSYDFLSAKRNETYNYYLKDIASNPYYSQLEQRLSEKYEGALFTKLYKTEIEIDKNRSVENRKVALKWIWVLVILLLLSLLANIYFFFKRKDSQNSHESPSFDDLTPQEQNIVREIVSNKTNKEIATSLFISVSTVKTHINNLNKKLNVTTRDEIKKLYS